MVSAIPSPSVTALPQTLLDHLRARQDEMTALLRDLALLESPSHEPAAQEPVFARLAAELAESGMRARRLQGKRTGGQLWGVPRERRRAPGRPPGAPARHAGPAPDRPLRCRLACRDFGAHARRGP